MERGFYNLNGGGSADTDLPVVVCRIPCRGEKAREFINHIMEVSATIEVTTVHLRHPDEDHDWTLDHTKVLWEEVTATRAEVKEIREHQAILERRVIEAELQVVESKAKTRAMQNFMASFHGPQNNTQRE